MSPSSQPATVRGPAFIRLLARFAELSPAESGRSLPDRLSQWLDWNHALALSTALEGKPAAGLEQGAAGGSAVADECAGVRRALARAGNDACASVAAGHAAAAAAAVDYADFRQCYLARQRAMQSATGRLRGRVRERLAATSAAMARLAEVDAAMEAALSPREHTLLAGVPALLGVRFERLRGTAGGPSPGTARTPWLEVFRHDMQGLLLAELDVRFQPVEGLLAALRTC
ncbi:MAG: DUF3348 domain-containing protein [Xanthomonadaceae bacterium]|nr:DUF3348 domain-containing protein [Xanthomonadaceae bacterium]